MFEEIITSKHNPRLKHVSRLIVDRSFRYEHEQFVAEGPNAVVGTPTLQEVYVREGTSIVVPSGVRMFQVGAAAFDHVAPTENSQGVLAVYCFSVARADAIDAHGRYVLLDRLQDPGNMGTVIRTACAFGFSGVILTPGCTDPFAPKVVRSAVGSILKTSIIAIKDIASELQGRTVIAADATGQNVATFVWPQGFILAIGNEGAGLSAEVRKCTSSLVGIPIHCSVESLNAAVAAGILMYCAGKK
jgi:TrmH family RNA methyltransferase